MAKVTVKNRYGVIPNNILNNKNLSMKAKGLWGYIQSKPENWNFGAVNIAKQTKDGKDGISAGLEELEEAGYLVRIKEKNEKGHWKINYILSENPVTENPTLENPLLENPETIVRKNISKQEYSNKELDSCENKFSREIGEVIKKFKEINPSLNYGNKTQRKAVLEMLKKFGTEKTLSMVDRVLSVQGVKYAPRATTPHTMWTKIGDFAVYFSAEKKTQIRNIIPRI